MIARLHAAPLHVQVLLMLAAAPTVVALFGLSLAPRAVASLAGDDPAVVIAVERAVLVAISLAVLGAIVAALSAAALLRGSLRAVVEGMHGATEAIADGHLRHRIGTRRRDELGRLADGIDAMAERLERLEDARRRMLACVSHELRTPLTIVRGHAYTLGRGETDPDRRARFELVDREAVRLTALVDELLEAACLHAGGVRLRRTTFDLRDAVNDVADRFAVAAADRAVVIETAGRALDVSADRARVAQVLGNLTANAIRHATPGTAVRLSVSRSDDGREARVDISNTGPPIPADAAERILEPFEQHGPAPGRVGLGLTIAHDLCAAHGGAIRLLDRGCGATGGEVVFRASLPLTSQPRWHR